MKKTILFSLLMLGAFIQINYAQETWVKQKLDDRIAVKFPKAPTQAGPSFKYKDNDSCGYNAVSQDFGAMGLDSATLAMMAPTDEFVEQFKTGFGANAGLDISKLDVTTWNNYPAYKIEAVTTKNKKVNVSMTCIFIGTKAYFVSFGAPDGFDGSKRKEQFMASIEEIK